MRSRLIYGRLPRDIENDLSLTHLPRVWELLEEKFAFNTTAWKKDFRDYLDKQPREVSEQEAFVSFGMEYIQPVLNKVLHRDEYHPTWRNLLVYIVKKF